MAEYSRAGRRCRLVPERPSGATHSAASSSAMNAFFPATWSLAATKWSMGSDPIVFDDFLGFILLMLNGGAMRKVCEYVSLVAVVLLVYYEVSYFNLRKSYMDGPLNPYVFFTDDVRLALEKASEDAREGKLTKEDAKALLRKHNVRCCHLDKGVVYWTISYCCLAVSVKYIYSPGKPYPDSSSLSAADVQRIGDNWYWEIIR